MKRITGFFLCIIIVVGLVTVPAHTSDYDGRYCRTALAELPKGDALCYAYDAMLAGFLALDGKIPLDVERGLTYDDVVTVAEALRSDCPEPFWQADGFSVSLKSDGRVSGITPNYVHTAAEAEAMTALMSREADEICALVHGTDEMQIALELHDALARRVTYNEGEDAHNAYGALVRGVAVCEGYARAYQYLLRRFGIESAVVIGDSRGGAHAWNLVCIDGAWVNVDVTWDDAGDKLFHRYFAVNDAVINEDHTRDATAYALPACVGEEYPYFKEGYNRFGTFSVGTLAALMSENFVSGTAYAEFLVGDSDAFAVWLSGHSRDLMSALGMTGSVSYATSALEGEMHLTFGSHKHTAGTSDGKAATCTEDGYAGNYYCTSCGALFSDAACCFVIDDLAAWRATDGRVAASGHNWDGGTVVTEPTETEKGVMRFTCTECGAERDGEIPVKEKEPDPVEPTKTFIDVSETSWFKGAVDYVVTEGLMNGVSETEFDPNGTMTRAMLVTVLWRLEGSPAASVKDPFTDLKQDWYKAAVAWAYEHEIVNGTAPDKFDPNGAITREQMAAIFYRYSEYKGYDVSSRGDVSTFPDAADVHSYANDPISWTVGEGLIGGVAKDGKSYLTPRGSATRAQVATILQRFCGKH